MLIFLATSFVLVLNAAVGVEYQSLSPNFVKPKRGVVDTGHNASQFRQSHNSNARRVINDNPQSSSSIYDGVFKQSSPYSSLSTFIRQSGSHSDEQSSPHFDNLFTMSAAYKVTSDKVAKLPKQSGTHSRNQNAVIAGIPGVTPSLNAQVPIYKTNYPLPKSLGSQTYSPVFQANSHADVITDKRISLPTVQAQNDQEFPPYLSSFQSQPLILNPADHQFGFAARTPKLNNVQLGASFLSPLSTFQGQVVPISTAGNSPQFPQYKGATIELYPAVGGFSTVGYQPLHAQPQLHFQRGNVQHLQPVGGLRSSLSGQEIRTDVEIIDKKNPTTPPPRKDDGDDDDEEGDVSNDREYRPNSEDNDDYERRSGKQFKAPQTEGNFKPSMSFPFKQYDEKFGKYSNQKYHDDSSLNDDNDEDKTYSNKYRSEDSSSKLVYSKQDDEEDEDDDKRVYEKQKTEENSDDTYRPKYFNNNFDEGFERSYRTGLPKQGEVHTKEVPEVEYGSRSSRRDKDSYDSEDNEGHSSDSLTSVIPSAFGSRIPKRNNKF